MLWYFVNKDKGNSLQCKKTNSNGILSIFRTSTHTDTKFSDYKSQGQTHNILTSQLHLSAKFYFNYCIKRASTIYTNFFWNIYANLKWRAEFVGLFSTLKTTSRSSTKLRNFQFSNKHKLCSRCTKLCASEIFRWPE